MTAEKHRRRHMLNPSSNSSRQGCLGNWNPWLHRRAHRASSHNTLLWGFWVSNFLLFSPQVWKSSFKICCLRCRLLFYCRIQTIHLPICLLVCFSAWLKVPFITIKSSTDQYLHDSVWVCAKKGFNVHSADQALKVRKINITYIICCRKKHSWIYFLLFFYSAIFSSQGCM